MPGIFQKAGKLMKLRIKVGNLESELETSLKVAVQQLPTDCSKTHKHISSAKEAFYC